MAISNPYPIEILNNRAVVELKGVAVLSFLHNILTCSVEKLNQGELAYGALLSPQGKILYDVFIHVASESVLFDCAALGRDDLIARLKLYRLRAKFEILTREDLQVQVGGDGVADPRHADLGNRKIVQQFGQGLAAQYETRRYDLGIADSQEIGSGKVFPHEANFDQFGGVDFRKGCYIGQEVVSRMQHRATARSRILPITVEADPFTDESRVMEILGRHGKQALGLVRLDRWAELGTPAGMTISTPDWMKL